MILIQHALTTPKNAPKHYEMKHYEQPNTLSQKSQRLAGTGRDKRRGKQDRVARRLKAGLLQKHTQVETQ